MTEFSLAALALDPAAEAARIESWIAHVVPRELNKRGAVVAVSGGIDSSVCVALAARALGRERVHALLLPEADAGAASLERGRAVCESVGVEFEIEDIGAALEALGCYRRRDDALRRVFPDYGSGWRQKIALAEGLLESDRVTYFTATVESPEGVRSTERMPSDVYREVVAATNQKQRTRKLVEYTHAEARNYAVVGTPNRLEYALGFFVRGGDGLSDLKPIAHLYKTQVFALAAHLGLPQEVLDQTPTTGTYSLPQTQEEFYFALAYPEMDLLLCAWEQNVSPAAAAEVMSLAPEQVERVYRDIVAKRRVATRLSQDALLVEPVGRRA
jgi:NAD+ synthase